jgi:hypothetical protein
MDAKGKAMGRGAGCARSRKRGAVLGGALALLVGGIAGPGPANAADPVEVEGTVGGALNRIDSYEVKCTKASRFLQATLQAIPPDGDDPSFTRFYMTAVGTVPASMDTQDFARVAETNPGKNPVTTLMVRPGPEGTMRAIVSVVPEPFGIAGASYRLTLLCAKGELFGDEPIVLTKTVVVQRENN